MDEVVLDPTTWESLGAPEWGGSGEEGLYREAGGRVVVPCLGAPSFSL